MSRHIIDRQIFELSFDDQLSAGRLQREWLTWSVPPLDVLTSHLLDEASQEKDFHHIHRMEIDLGILPENSLGSEEMLSRFRDVFLSTLKKLLAQSARLTPAAYDWEICAFFLRTGDLPWWADKQLLTDMDSLLRKAIAANPAHAAAFFQQEGRRHTVWQRIQQQCSVATCRLIEKLCPALLMRSPVLPALIIPRKSLYGSVYRQRLLRLLLTTNDPVVVAWMERLAGVPMPQQDRVLFLKRSTVFQLAFLQRIVRLVSSRSVDTLYKELSSREAASSGEAIFSKEEASSSEESSFKEELSSNVVSSSGEGSFSEEVSSFGEEPSSKEGSSAKDASFWGKESISKEEVSSTGVFSSGEGLSSKGVSSSKKVSSSGEVTSSKEELSSREVSSSGKEVSSRAASISREGISSEQVSPREGLSSKDISFARDASFYAKSSVFTGEPDGLPSSLPSAGIKKLARLIARKLKCAVRGPLYEALLYWPEKELRTLLRTAQKIKEAHKVLKEWTDRLLTHPRLLARLLLYLSPDGLPKMAPALEDISSRQDDCTAKERHLLLRCLKRLPEERIHLLHHLANLPQEKMQQMLSSGTRAATNEEENGTGAAYRMLIGNAGLCLFAPYLPMFFRNLGYMEQDQFKSIRDASRAVYLLQFIATGRQRAPEHQLLLNKLLCGLPPATAIPRTIRLSRKELEEATRLVLAVIANWNALKQTTADGLRGTFLCRNGILRDNGTHHTLQVERKEYDILLNGIPWGYSLIKLPWMKQHMTVEW